MALAWGQSSGNVEHALRLAGALWLFWLHYGYLNEGRHYLEELLVRGEGSGNKQALASVIEGAGALAWLKGDSLAARSRLERSLTLARTLRDKRLIAEVLIFLGWVTLYQGDDVQASFCLAESLMLAKELGDKMALADALTAHGDLAREHGDYKQAAIFFEESLALSQELGAKADVAQAYIVLGQLRQLQGDRVRARVLLKASLAQLRDLGITRGFRIPTCLEELASICAMEGELSYAACLFGAAEALREMIGELPSDQIADMHRQLGEGTFAAAWAAGRSMPPGRMIDYALALPDLIEAAPPIVPPPPSYPAGLTLREVEVLRLLANGLTYVQIADELVITPRTVNAHLTSIYAKLGVTSRAAATRFAVEHHVV